MLKQKWSPSGTKNIVKLKGPRADVNAAVARLRLTEINPGSSEHTTTPQVRRNPITGTTRVRYFSSTGMLSKSKTTNVIMKAIYPTVEDSKLLSLLPPKATTVSNPQKHNWFLSYHE